LRHLDRVLLWLARIYLAAAVLVILFAEASQISRDGLAVYWGASFSPAGVVRNLLLVTPGLLLLGFGSLAERRRFGSWRPDWERPQRGMYLIGCVAFSLGVEMFLAAGLGVDPFHAMTIGIVRAVNQPYVGVGLVDGAVTLALLFAWMAWNRRLPPLSIFVTMLLVGCLIDLWDVLGLKHGLAPALPPLLLMLLGLLLVAYGSALIIMSGIGLRVVDLVALSFVRHLRWRFYMAKLAVEAGFLAGGLLSGGPIGLATVAFVFVVGPFVEPMIWANHRYLHLPDRGLRPAMRSAAEA
jgi:uncharacterized membrane protein YczE